MPSWSLIPNFSFCGQLTACDLRTSAYRNLNHWGWSAWFQNVSDLETFSSETYWFSQDPGLSASLKRRMKPPPLIKEALLGMLFRLFTSVSCYRSLHVTKRCYVSMQHWIFVCFGKVRGWLSWKSLWSSITTSNQSARTQEQRGYGSAPGCMFISLTKYPCMHVCILPSFPTHFILRSYWRISRHPESKSLAVSIQSAPKCTHRDLVFAMSISSGLS